MEKIEIINAEAKMALLAAGLKKAGIRICPNCGKSYSDAPALSRKDNKTEICPDCGMLEAIDDWEQPK